MTTYNPRKISAALGKHVVSGFADDSFISIEPAGDGNTHVVGADGEVVVSVDPSSAYTLKLALLQGSKTNKYLNQQYEKLKSSGNGYFSVTVKDLIGKSKFSAATAWVSKPPSTTYGKTAGNREWEITIADGKLTI